MKDLVINGSINLIKKNKPDYSQENLEIIKYGLLSVYLLVSKTVMLVLIAIILGIIKELAIFILIYSIIRMPSFGLHATKSYICFIASSFIFIGSTYLSATTIMPIWLKIIVGLICTLLLFKNSPADTAKRPIISPKRRLVYKIITTCLAIIFILLAVLIKNNFLANCFIFSLVVQSFVTAPTIYKLFKLPYNNYKNYPNGLN